MSLQFRRRATPAREAREPLVELALAGPEIQDALGISSSVVLGSSTRLRDISHPVECFQAEYGSCAGDRVGLLLSRCTSADDAVDFGLRMKSQLEEDQKGTEILVRLTPQKFRWLDRSGASGIRMYHGGANEGSIAMDLTWQPTRMLSDDQAALALSDLLDAQFKKIAAAR